MIRAFYEENMNCVRINNEKSGEFTTDIGVKQWQCLLSPLMFSVIVVESIKGSKKHDEKGENSM